MPTRRDIVFLFGTACAAIAAPAAAAETSARAFVTAIYDAYKGKDGNGVAFDSEPAVRRYFEPSLAALIRKDQDNAARRDEAATLDFDPFVDASDWDIAAFDIAVRDTAPDKASATVSFNNRDRPTIVVLDLVNIKNEWKITEIAWRRDGTSKTLRGLFAR